MNLTFYFDEHLTSFPEVFLPFASRFLLCSSIPLCPLLFQNTEHFRDNQRQDHVLCLLSIAPPVFACFLSPFSTWSLSFAPKSPLIYLFSIHSSHICSSFCLLAEIDFPKFTVMFSLPSLRVPVLNLPFVTILALCSSPLLL